MVDDFATPTSIIVGLALTCLLRHIASPAGQVGRACRVFAAALAGLGVLTDLLGMTAEAAPRRMIRIVALGDSTTAEYSNWAPEVRQVYADCLRAALAQHGFSATVVNAGICDTTTRDAVLRLDHDVFRHDPDLMVVQFGINDSWIDADLGLTHPPALRQREES